MKTIFWDVDTQIDFIFSYGNLYVPGSEEIIENIGALTDFARKNKIQIVASVDDHSLEDPEISQNPDWKETFPPHCMHGTEGQKKIKASLPKHPLVLDAKKTLTEKELKLLVEKHSGEIVLTKQKFNVFSNPHTLKLISHLAPTDIVVYGVALDICVAHTVEGFLKQGGLTVHLIEDATKPIDADKGKALLQQWGTCGVKFTTTQRITKGQYLQVVA